MGSDVHRNVTQLLLDQGVYSEDKLLDVLRACIEAHPAEAKRVKLKMKNDSERDNKLLATVVEAINTQLEPLGLKVAKMKFRKTPYYGLVNLVEDDLAKAAQPLGKAEQEYFHRLVGEILGAPGSKLDHTQAESLGKELSTKMPLQEVRACLLRLENAHWLLQTDEGEYLLGVRSELQRRYLKDEADEGEGAGGSGPGVVEMDE